MKIVFILFLILALLVFSIPTKTTAGSFPNVYHFDFDPTLVPDGTLLKDHPQIKWNFPTWLLFIKNNRIESDHSHSTSIRFDTTDASNFLELIVDAEDGFRITDGRAFTFRYTDAFGNSHLVTDVFPAPVILYTGKTTMHLQLKFENGQWFSKYKIIPQRPIWTNWRAENTTNKNKINDILIGFNARTITAINDIKVFSPPDWAPPDFSLFAFPYDQKGTTTIRTPNYTLDSILTTDFSVQSEICPITNACIMPFSKMIDEIRLIMYDTKTGEIRYLIKYPRSLPYQIYLDPPAPNVPDYIHMQTTMKEFRPSTWLLLGYKVFWKDGFAWYFPEWDNHTFIIKDSHLTKPLPPPERPEMPDIIPPVLFPEPPPVEPKPEALLDRLVWRVEGFLREIFLPSPDAINNLNYEILRLQHRFPVNYINETRKFFYTLTYTPTNPHPPTMTMAFPIIGQEPIEIEILNFHWINNPMYIFGISTTIAELLKTITTLFIAILFITFTIAIIKIIL